MKFPRQQRFLAAAATLLGGLALATAAIAAKPALSLSYGKASGKGTQVVMSYEQAGEVTALDFVLAVPSQMGSKPSIKACAAGLPDSHVGQCEWTAQGTLKMIVFSPSNKVLPSTEIGRITLAAPGKPSGLKGGSGLRLREVHMFNSQGEPVQAQIGGAASR